MKIRNKIFLLLMSALLPLGFAGCSDDDKKDVITEGETPDFVLDQESVTVKIGSANKVEVTIKDGGGEYSAFCLDESVAKVESVNGVLMVEGFANGETSLIISDKYSRYRRLPVSVYTTDEMLLSDVTVKVPLGRISESSIEIAKGNGGYTVESDNPDVEISVTETDQIVIGTSAEDVDKPITITVTDRMGLTGTFTVTVEGALMAYTNYELEKIKASTKRVYDYDGFVLSSTYESIFSFYNETLADGRQRYGWGYSTYYAFHLDFAGGKSVGVKENANFTFVYWGKNSVSTTVTLEIIKNDGTNIWGTFYYLSDDGENVFSGYFCDAV